MGEYVNHSKLGYIKLGTCEDLYYTTFQQLQENIALSLLSSQPGNLEPEEYLNPEKGFRYRFPFPDEDGTEIGDYHKFEFNRGVEIILDYFIEFDHEKVCLKIPKKETSNSNINIYVPCPHSADFKNVDVCYRSDHRQSIEIIQQKQIDKELWTVIRCPYCHAAIRLEKVEALKLAECVRKNADKNNPDSITFYNEIANRILAGYSN
jgi:hypothetical protein